MKHLPWNAYLAMSGKQNRQLSADEQALLNAAVVTQYQAQRDPNSPYWQGQVASCRAALSDAHPEHMAALEAALPGLFTPGVDDSYRDLNRRLAPIVRRVYVQYQTATDLIAAFQTIHRNETTPQGANS